MEEVKANDKVKVHYTGSLSDGTIFDSSENREPFEFKVGAGQVIKGFEEAVIGLKKDESIKVTIPADEAYGPFMEERLQKVSKEQLPADIKPEIGMELASKYPDGQEIIVRVRSIEEDHIVIDANHPLAGLDLTFTIKVVEIN